MIIDFSKIMSVSGRTEEFSVPIEEDEFDAGSFRYRYDDRRPVRLTLSSPGRRILRIKAVIDVTLNIPCDRCLKDVMTRVYVEASRKIDFSADGTDGNVDYADYKGDISFESPEDYKVYIRGTGLDVEKFIHSEIMMNLPMKVLCKEDCRGIRRGGKDLSDSLDTTEPDPRMAKAIEVFNSFKEV